MDKKRLNACLLLTVSALIWGIASPVIKFTLSQIKPFTFLFYRFLLTLIIFLPPMVVIAKREKETFSSLLKIAPLGFLGVGLTLTLVFLGIEKTSALDSAVLAAISPIFICVAGVFFLKEEISRREMVGIGLAMAGTLVTIVQPFLDGKAFASQNLIGNLILVASDLTWTAYVIFSKEEFKKHSPFVICATSFIVSFFAIIPFALLEQGSGLFQVRELVFESGAFWGILYMSLFSSVIAYLGFELGLKLIEASEATLFAYLQPLFAAPVAVAWLGEKISTPFVVGILFITVGIIMAEYRPKCRRKKQPNSCHEGTKMLKLGNEIKNSSRVVSAS